MRIFKAFLFAFLLITSGCKNINNIRTQLENAEANMELQPNIALNILDSIDQNTLPTKMLKARYSLLYSMALDKNYIDITHDTIIAPAINYYKNHGSADEKLKANYYWGRVAMNRGEYETAIDRFVLAEKYASRTNDKIAAGRLFKAQTNIYKYCHDTKAMILSAERTANIFKELGDTAKYITAMFDLTAGYLSKLDTLKARQAINTIKAYWNDLGERHKSHYYANLLLLNSHSPQISIPDILRDYEKEIHDPRLFQWLTVAKAYYLSNEYSKALDAIEKYTFYGGATNDAYYWTSGLIHEALGNAPEGMKSYKNYIDSTDEKLGYLIDADIRFIKERYENDINIRKNRLILVVLVFSILVLIFGSLAIFYRIKAKQIKERLLHEQEIAATTAEKDYYAQMYDSALSEINDLNDALKNIHLEKNIRQCISERLGLLNKFIASNLTPHYSKNAAIELEHLMRDKAHFIDSTRISFLIEHPKFIQKLKKNGLTDNEIGYCCLYAMGFNGKDISSFLGAQHYKLSSLIRKKFGLNKHDTNLDIFLREILTKTSK